MSKSSRIHFTFEGMPIETLFLAPTQDKGFSFGFTSPENENVHLTIYYSPRDGRIHGHITDPVASVKQVWSTQVSRAYFDAVRKKLTATWVKPAARLPRCWAMSPDLWDKVRSFMPTLVSEGKIRFPLEGYYTRIQLNFRRRDRWDWIPASEMLRHAPAFGYTLIGDRPHMVLPIPPTGETVICFTERQSRLALERIYGLLGFTEYFRYLELRESLR